MEFTIYCPVSDQYLAYVKRLGCKIEIKGGYVSGERENDMVPQHCARIWNQIKTMDMEVKTKWSD